MPPFTMVTIETTGVIGPRTTAHFASLAVCFLSSAISDAAPALANTADKTFEFSCETTEMSKAAGFPRSQSCTRISAGLDWERSVLTPAAASTRTDKCAVWKDSVKISRRLLWQNIASPPLLQVVAWWPRGS